jgi:filamentous hemagglutinin family protein
MARPVASSPAVAGFRPAGAALAVAAAFALQPAALQAQPSGAQVVHGQASIVRNGNNVSITTQNGAGTSHSAINWQSFSVPSGSVAHFSQPTATSTSINRVTGPDPSAIFGTLSSNGRLVLVNPAGIAVGQGAVVDTGGFTASTLRMSDADALAGRMRFSGGAGGPLQVDGRIIARSGDVVLIAPQVQAGTSALVESNGSTILAAGQKVELTGRGLEGIHMEVQAGNEAVNLGTLKGDAVGVFAHTLKHSGLVDARAATSEGGKVVLKAIGGDALVDGRVAAAGLAGKGGQVDVLGNRVALLAGAIVEVSGQAGGGQVRIGGDYQGANAAVPNAQRTYVDANARIHADAIQSGNGGRVIVWADGDTRMDGQISARGGAAGGDGGFVEVSGKQALAFGGLVDLRAPQGATGTLLLDPEDVNIVDGPNSNSYSPGGDPFVFQPSSGPLTLNDGDIEYQLGFANVKITTASPGTGGNITMASDADIVWTNNHSLTMEADKSIFIQGTISNTNDSTSAVTLKAKGGNVEVNGGSVVAGSVTLDASQDVKIASGTTQSNGGPLVITAGQNVEVDSGSVVQSTQSTLSVIAGKNILGSGNFRTFGSTSVDGEDGRLSLVANDGSVSFSSARTYGNPSRPHGGKVVISATGNVAGGVIDTQGYSGFSSPFGGAGGAVDVDAGGSISISNIGAGGGDHSLAAGKGGLVTLDAVGDITIGGVSASGGSGFYFSSAPGAGGMGGDVVITSTAGHIDVGYVDTQGGGGATGNKGGDITLNAAGNVDVETLDASGGSAQGSGTAGNGGKVVVVAGGNITLRPYEIAIRSDGGDAESGQAGSGGRVELKAGGDIVVVPPAEPELDLVAIDTEAFVPPDVYAYGVSAIGGWGGTPGTGGDVVAEAGGSLSLGLVDVTGGDADAGLGGTGGQGGNVRLKFGNAISSTIVGALGGSGDSGTAGGTGGKGGTIKLERTGSGDMVLDGTVVLFAAGGQGGDSTANGGTPGAGGKGGDVELLAHGGRVVLRSPMILTEGGEGGSNADETAVGAKGALGNLSAMGTSVEVEAPFFLNAIWNNSSNVHIRNAAVTGNGAFRNLSDLFFYGDASMDVSGGVENKGRLTTFGNNLVNLKENYGFVDVVAGSTMVTPEFLTNKGKVQVNGRLDIGLPRPPDTTASAVPSVSGDTFVNESTGVLTGNGTIAVDNGDGLVNNFGTINPGAIGGTGLLTLESSLAMQPGSTLAMDLLSASSFDAVKVTGTAATGGTIAVNLLPGAGFQQGATFAVIQSGNLDASTMPSVSLSQLEPTASGNNLVLVAGSAVVPFGAPEIQEVNNQVVQFASLFLEEAERQRRAIGKDDIVVTDTACTPQ